MLPDVLLDDEEYKDILNEARNMAVSLYPEWTDYNAHDPGVTILELFAVMKESQQFYMNQIGNANREKYLKLLGVSRRSKRAAHSLVQFQVDSNLSLLCGHKLNAGEICFETLHKKQLTESDVCLCISVYDEEEKDFFSRRQAEFGGGLHFFPFGKKPARGSQCYICFLQGLPTGEVMDIYLEIFKEYPVRRNPLGGQEFVPLASLRWQYYTAQGWKDIGGLWDETCGFLFDGFVQFILDKPMERTQVMEQEGYFIRVLLQEEEYDVAPVITGISINVCKVVQQETLVECFLQVKRDNFVELDTELSVLGGSEVYLGKGGVFYPAAFEKTICREQGRVRFEIEDERLADADSVLVINRDLSCIHKRFAGTGNGFPNQEIVLEDIQVMRQSLVILAEDEETGGFVFWQRVSDFSNSSPEDRHYIFDSQRGVICFGDCIHGMAPEGRILVAGYVRTLGSGGNIKAGKITHFRMDGLDEINLTNICAGIGGEDEETLEEGFLRARKYLEKPDCAVTAQDYEQYVRETPGLMIESCKVLHMDDVREFCKNLEETAVYVVVKPYGWTAHRQSSQSYCRNIRGYLEGHRMVGDKVIVLFPEYVEVEVYVEVMAMSQYLHIEQRVIEAVEKFLGECCGGVGGAVIYSRLYGYIDRLEFIRSIRALNMDARGGGVRRNVDGDILLPPNGVIAIKEVKVLSLG